MTRTIRTGRRTCCRAGLALAGSGIVGIPEWVLPALAQGETVVPFLDFPDRVITNPAADRRIIDIRTIRRSVHAEGSVLHDAALRPSRWWTLATYQLAGLGPGRPAGLALARRSAEDGRRRSWSPDSSAPATGVRCRVSRATAGGRACRCKTVLDKAGVKLEAREFVFFGADRGEEEVEWRTQKFKVEQQFGRSLHAREGAVARAVPGLRVERRAADAPPGRARSDSSCPAGTASANVKWLSEIHVQEEQYSASSRRAGIARSRAR